MLDDTVLLEDDPGTPSDSEDCILVWWYLRPDERQCSRNVSASVKLAADFTPSEFRTG